MSKSKHSDIQVISHEHEINAKKWLFDFSKMTTLVSMILAILAISCCGYLMYRGNSILQQQLEVNHNIEELRNIANLNGGQASMQLPDNLAAVLQDITAQVRAQKKATKALESIVISDVNPKINFLLEAGSKNQPIMTGQQNDATLIFVVNALKEAELYMTILYDIKMASKFLNIAAQLLSNQQNTIYTEVKDAIIDDQKQLASIKVPDKSAIFITVNELLSNLNRYAYKKTNLAIMNNTNTMPTATNNDNMHVTAKEPKADDTPQPTGWQIVLKKTLQDLASLVKIKNNNIHNDAINSIISLQEKLQRQRLQFYLEQIRIASFGDNDELFHNLLLTTKDIFLEYFMEDDTLNQQAIAKLDSLREINLLPPNTIHLNSLSKAEALLQQPGTEQQ